MSKPIACPEWSGRHLRERRGSTHQMPPRAKTRDIVPPARRVLLRMCTAHAEIAAPTPSARAPGGSPEPSFIAEPHHWQWRFTTFLLATSAECGAARRTLRLDPPSHSCDQRRRRIAITVPMLLTEHVQFLVRHILTEMRGMVGRNHRQLAQSVSLTANSAAYRGSFR